MKAGHRRTHAKQAPEEQQRMSVPTHYNPPTRFSFEPDQNSPLFFRSSDMSYIRNFNPSSLATIPPPPPAPEKSEAPRLMQTFQELQDKLSMAKKQLNIANERPHHRKESSFELKSWKESSVENSLKESSRMNDLLPEESFLVKIDQSTINLESQKKFINLRSKEKLPWVSKIKTYYIAEVAKASLGLNERALEHISLSHEVLKARKGLTLPDASTIPRLEVHLPQAEKHKGKKVMIIDLDETLFHTSQERVSEDDLEVDIPCEEGFEKAYIAIRPFAISFLKRANRHFEVIAFTASERTYADAILDELDPDGQLIHHRLYRDHCVRLNAKIYAKDLSIINRDLSQMILVDNSPLSYLYQIENGVPVLPYYEGEDNQLLQLEKYLELVRRAQDVREINRKTFKLESYWYFNDVEEMIQDLYCGEHFF